MLLNQLHKLIFGFREDFLKARKSYLSFGLERFGIEKPAIRSGSDYWTERVLEICPVILH